MTDRFVGVDVAADRLHCVAIDDRLAVTGTAVFSAAEMRELGDWLDGTRAVAVDAPEQLSAAPHSGDQSLSPKFAPGRCAEIALGRDYGTWVPWVTPTTLPVAKWIATGFEVYSELRRRGIEALEVYPYGGYRELVRPKRLPKKQTSEGIRVRVRALQKTGVEEANLQMWSHDGLDALLAAVIARDYYSGVARAATCGHDGSAIWLPAPA